jgi:Domain of unknown function (DUF397)
MTSPPDTATRATRRSTPNLEKVDMSGIADSTLSWRKAAASGHNGCVEVAPLPDGGVAVRDSKDGSGAMLSFSRHEWVSFLDGLSKGEFDHLV